MNKQSLKQDRHGRGRALTTSGDVSNKENLVAIFSKRIDMAGAGFNYQWECFQ